MKKFTVEQYEFLEKLRNRFPSNFTIRDILAREDLNPYRQDGLKIPVEEVQFNISGIQVYAYECTGEALTYSGTIKEIIAKLLGDYRLFNTENSNKNEVIKIKDFLNNEEIEGLASFFLGYRDDPCLDKVKAVSNREVTLKEIIEYISEIEVVNEFKYANTIIEY